MGQASLRSAAPSRNQSQQPRWPPHVVALLVRAVAHVPAVRALADPLAPPRLAVAAIAFDRLGPLDGDEVAGQVALGRGGGDPGLPFRSQRWMRVSPDTTSLPRGQQMASPAGRPAWTRPSVQSLTATTSAWASTTSTDQGAPGPILPSERVGPNRNLGPAQHKA